SVRTVAENRLASCIGTVFRTQKRVLFSELLRFGGSGQRGRRCQTAANYLLHLIKISGSDKALMLYGFVSVLRFAAELFLLQSRISTHTGQLVSPSQFKHAQVQ